MTGLDELREHGRVPWSDAEQGWVPAPDEVMSARSSNGFGEDDRVKEEES
jgi:hypothetical protein